MHKLLIAIVRSSLPQEFEGRFCLLDGGRDEVLHLLALLKSRGFVLMILENVEAFEERLHGSEAQNIGSQFAVALCSKEP